MVVRGVLLLLLHLIKDLPPLLLHLLPMHVHLLHVHAAPLHLQLLGLRLSYLRPQRLAVAHLLLPESIQSRCLLLLRLWRQI